MTINDKPTSVDDLVFPSAHVEKRVRQYADNKRNGNIILYGPKGTGKSATAYVIADTRSKAAQSTYPIPVYNGADVDSSTFDRMYNDWSWQRINGVKQPYVIIDEVDKLSAGLQHKLRAVLDSTELGNVILTTNHIHRVDEPLVDRCDDIEMPPINLDNWRGKVDDWLTAEGIEVDNDYLNDVLRTNNGTIRDLKRAVEDIKCEHK